MRGIDIPILRDSLNPEEDPTWTSFFGSKLHPDLQEPVFVRHNGCPLSLAGMYAGETCFLIGRGPSLQEYVENKELFKTLNRPDVIRYCMNTSLEVFNNNATFWSVCDKATKFDRSGFLNGNIQKFLPLNRFRPNPNDSKAKVSDKTYVGKIHNKIIHTSHCPNTVGVSSFLLDGNAKNINFENAYLGSSSVLFGQYTGHKSVLLFSLKVALILGFSKIVLMGVDFKMREDKPYYGMKKGAHPKFYVDHNNKLYADLGPKLEKIVELVNNGQSGYKTTISSGKKIEALPSIPVVDIAKLIKKEIEWKKNVR